MRTVTASLPPCRYIMYELQDLDLLGGFPGRWQTHMADLTAKCSTFFVVKT